MSQQLLIIQEIFSWILNTSLIASLLVFLLLFVKRVFKYKLQPRWQYAIWLVLLLRLLLPWSPESSYSLENIVNHGQDLVSDFKIIEKTTPLAVDTNPHQNLSHTNLEHTKTVQVNDSNPLDTGSNSKDIPLSDLLLYTWVLGVILFFSYTIWVNRRFVKKIMLHSSPVSQDLVDMLEECKSLLSIKSNVQILQSPIVKSPTLIGYCSPTIILPTNINTSQDTNQLKHILFHELAHIKRHDLGVNWIMNGLLILHWFNPILWYGYYRMREDQEIACDALVLSIITHHDSRDYGRTIISLLETLSHQYVPGTAKLSGTKTQIKRRIVMIKQFRKNSYRWSILGLGTLVILGTFALASGKNVINAVSKMDTVQQNEVAKNIFGFAQQGILSNLSLDTQNKEISTLNEREEIAKAILALAKQGELDGFSLNSQRRDIVRKWGPLSLLNALQIDIDIPVYSTGYPRKKIGFTFDDDLTSFDGSKLKENKGKGTVVSLVSYNKKYAKLTPSLVKKVFGKPFEERNSKENSHGHSLSYKLGKYHFEIVFPNKKSEFHQPSTPWIMLSTYPLLG